MKRTSLRVGAIITGSDRQTGRFMLNPSPTLTQGAALFKAGRLHAAVTARKLNRGSLPRRISSGLAYAGRRFLMLLGIL